MTIFPKENMGKNHEFAVYKTFPEWWLTYRFTTNFLLKKTRFAAN
jgi:hypothetical protein